MCGLAGLAAAVTVYGAALAILLSPVALGLGLSGKRACDRGESSGRGMALWGFVTGIVGTAVSVLIVGYFAVVLLLFVATAPPS